MSARITLPKTSKTSLHERFTKLAAVVKTTSAPPKPAANRARNAASSRNAAAQLAMRPSVQAALKIKNKTIKQRLGNLNQNKPINAGGRLQRDNSFNNNNRQNLKSRLGVPNVPRQAGGIGAGVGARLTNRLRFNQRPMRVQQQAGALNRSLSASKMTANSRVRFNQNKINTSINKVNRVNRVNNPKAGFKSKTKSPKIQNLKGKIQSAGMRQSFGKNNKAPLNIKKSLDMDLDQYMSKTKSHLDSDLDSYMAKSKTHLDADLDTYMAQTTAQ